MNRITPANWIGCIFLVLVMLLTGCTNGSELELHTNLGGQDAMIQMHWREFTLTNAEGKQLVMDHNKGDYPEGDMKHGKFHSISQAPALLYFDAPHSDSFTLEVNGGRFECSVSAETYGGYAYGSDVRTMVISNGVVSMEGGAGTVWMSMDMPELDWELRLEGDTKGKTVMTRDGSSVTITGVAGTYSLLAAKGDESWRDPIEGITEIGTLSIDLSRIEENLLTITDGDSVTTHELKKS